MAPFVLLLNATKLLGVAGFIAVTLDSIAYRSFRKKHLLPFESPIDEDQEVLASFAIDKDVDDGGFFFALATAPAHVEDKLQDSWLEFAAEDAGGEPKSTGEEERADAPGEEEEEEEAPTHGATESEESGAAKDGKEGEESAQKASNPSAEASEIAPGKNGGATVESKSSVTPTTSEWEVVSDSSDKGEEAANAEGGAVKEGEGVTPELIRGNSLVTATGVKRRHRRTDATLQFNVNRNVKQLGKVAMEAMIRGIDKISEMADDGGEESSNVAAWQNAFRPEERLRFWTEPETELKLARDANVTVFRMGVDWSRIVPVEPVNGLESVVNWQAVNRYREIIEKVRAHGMQVMLTLFHHSLPVWAAKFGGWKNAKTTKYFVEFSRLIAEKYTDLVDFWVIFNEPHVFAMLTYCAGAWPGGDPNLLETATAVLPKGVFKVVMAAMADCHLQIYDIIHDIGKKMSKRAKVGVAHHVSFTRPYGLPDVPLAMLSNMMTRFAFIDDTIGKMDFLGINYYGQEIISAPGLKYAENEEYSESGRGVYPDGLFRVLTSFHDRYKKFGLPYIITENGVSDSSDYIRRPYITEHLLAVKAAMARGVPVQGYCFWTTSDNWEWADGYGPKFGLVAVDRHNDLARTPRPSYHLFAEIAKTGNVTKQQRDQAWEELMTVAEEGKLRPFCREVDEKGLMYSGGLDTPTELPYAQRDWRFGHYEVEGLQDPLSRFVRFILSGQFLRRGKSSKSEGVGKSTKGLQEKGVPDLGMVREEERALAGV